MHPDKCLSYPRRRDYRRIFTSITILRFLIPFFVGAVVENCFRYWIHDYITDIARIKDEETREWACSSWMLRFKDPVRALKDCLAERWRDTSRILNITRELPIYSCKAGVDVLPVVIQTFCWIYGDLIWREGLIAFCYMNQGTSVQSNAIPSYTRHVIY